MTDGQQRKQSQRSMAQLEKSGRNLCAGEMPTADEVATALITACRLTGEDPENIIVARPSHSYARHYAFQALRVAFPEVLGAALARMLRCSGNEQYWSVNSNNGMARFQGGPHKGKRRHRFWDEQIFQRVIAAVRELAQVEDVPAFLSSDDGIEMPPDVRSVFDAAKRMQGQIKGISVPARKAEDRDGDQGEGQF